jgi:hypothetical protein
MSKRHRKHIDDYDPEDESGSDIIRDGQHVRVRMDMMDGMQRAVANQIAENDREVDHINAQLPKGEQRIESAEFVARELEGWRIGFRERCLPRFQHDQHNPYAWPINSARIY